MKWAKVLLIIAVPLLILGLALGTAGTAMACPDGPTQIGPDGGIVTPSSGDSTVPPIVETDPTPTVASQASTNIISFLIPVAASVGGLAIAAFVLRKRIHRKINPRTCQLLPNPAEGYN